MRSAFSVRSQRSVSQSASPLFSHTCTVLVFTLLIFCLLISLYHHPMSLPSLSFLLLLVLCLFSFSSSLDVRVSVSVPGSDHNQTPRAHRHGNHRSDVQPLRSAARDFASSFFSRGGEPSSADGELDDALASSFVPTESIDLKRALGSLPEPFRSLGPQSIWNFVSRPNPANESFSVPKPFQNCGSGDSSIVLDSISMSQYPMPADQRIWIRAAGELKKPLDKLIAVADLKKWGVTLFSWKQLIDSKFIARPAGPFIILVDAQTPILRGISVTITIKLMNPQNNEMLSCLKFDVDI